MGDYKRPQYTDREPDKIISINIPVSKTGDGRIVFRYWANVGVIQMYTAKKKGYKNPPKVKRYITLPINQITLKEANDLLSFFEQTIGGQLGKLADKEEGKRQLKREKTEEWLKKHPEKRRVKKDDQAT